MHMSPVGLLHCEPVAVGFQPKIEEPFRLTLLLGDKPHHVLVESTGDNICVNVGGEAIFILFMRHLLHIFVFIFFVYL